MQQARLFKYVSQTSIINSSFLCFNIIVFVMLLCYPLCVFVCERDEEYGYIAWINRSKAARLADQTHESNPEHHPQCDKQRRGQNT